ncbi:hypothetical protein SAMD00019534_052520, partial [Acytostelium subglobosum LB1]|uniref:hypothetical protein n=1 Tax=Acytostelium subglobosum LB1 TaxID=1410327 RepID=UPI000644EECD
TTTTTTTMEQLVTSLKKQFANNGFNIVEPFMVNDYNNACKYKLNNMGNDNAMGLVVGCSKHFWEHFVRFIVDLDQIPKDPMNTFCLTTIEQVLSSNDEAQKHRFDVRYDWNTVQSGRYAHMQTAGHFAGVAHYDQDVMWSIHPEYGLWFVFRAIIVFDVPFTGERPTPARNLFTTEAKREMMKWTTVAIDEGWSNLETRLKIRESCPHGRELYRYEGDMFDYFYPIQRSARSVLESIIQQHDSTVEGRLRKQSSSSSATPCNDDTIVPVSVPLVSTVPDTIMLQ